MKRRLKDFTVKLFSLILAITMCIPTNVYALADDGDEEMPTIMRLDEDSETDQTEETSDTEDPPTISEEDRNNYDISYDAKLSDSFDSIIYTIKVSKKEESIHDPEKKMTLALATNKNQSLTDLQVEHVRDLEEGDIDYSVDKEEGDLHTFAITTPTSKTGLEYTIKAPIAKDAIDTEKLYSLDMSVDIGDVNIDLRRISYKFMEETDEANPEEVRLVLTKIKEADDAFQKIAYNKSDEEDKADSLVYTDYLISKDKQDEASISEKRNEVNYKLILDENQDPTTGKIALDYYKANDKGFVLQKEFSTEIAYQEDLTLDVPAGYLLKLTYTNQTDKTKTKVENYSVNKRQVKNPRFVKEEEKKEDDKEDPAPAEKEEKPAEKDSNKQTKENESKTTEKDKKEEKKEDKKEDPSKKEEKAKELTNLEKADAELKKALADPKNTIKEIQALLDTFEKKYNLSKADQEKLMTDNDPAIKALVEKDRKENFRPNVLATVESKSFADKKFNLKATIQVKATDKLPIPKGHYVDVKVGPYLTKDANVDIEPLTYNGKTIATGEYNEEGHYIRYTYVDEVRQNMDLTIDQILAFYTPNIGYVSYVDIDIKVAPKGNPVQSMPRITVRREDPSPVDSSYKITDQGEIKSGTYPYQLNWRTTSQKLKDNTGKEINKNAYLDKDKLQGAYVEWDIEVDTDKLIDPENPLTFDNLNLTVFGSANQGLQDFRFRASKNKDDLNETDGYTFSDNMGELLSQSTQIAKSQLGDKLYIKVKALIDPDQVHETYNIGFRINPDKNYIDNLLTEYKDRFDRLPTPIKWLKGVEDAQRFAEVPFNLVETNIPATFLGLNDKFTNERFYYDNTRTIVADRKSDSRADWYALDLLRRGETQDEALDNPTFDINNGKNNQTIRPTKVYFVPLKDGGYRKTTQSQDAVLPNGQYYPGTIVSYEYLNEKGGRNDTYNFRTSLKKKKKYNIDESNETEGGSVNLFTEKVSNQALLSGYLAYVENPYPVMRINKNFDMVSCFNDRINAPVYDGSKGGVFLDIHEDVSGDYLLGRLNESIGNQSGTYSLRDLLTKGKAYNVGAEFGGGTVNLNKGDKTQGQAMEELMKKIYFYGEEVKKEYSKERNNEEMHRMVEASMYQRVIHHFTDGKALSQDYFDAPSDYNVDEWKVEHTLQGNRKPAPQEGWEDSFDGGDETRKTDLGLRKLKDNETRIKNYPPVQKTQYEMAKRLYRKVIDSYKNDSNWNNDKADSVELVFYSHTDEGKYQELIAGRVMAPIEIDKYKRSGDNIFAEKLPGAKFKFTNVETGESKEWTSPEDGKKVNKLYLRPGRYNVQEIDTPAGYEKIKDFEITVKRTEINPDNGPYDAKKLPKIHVNDGFKTEVVLANNLPQTPDGKALVAIDKNNNIKVNVTNIEDNLGKLEFVKRNKFVKLNGAEFRLRKINATDLNDAKNKFQTPENLTYDTKYDKKSKGSYGEFKFEQIPAGFYVLEETKVPEGYEKAPLYLLEAKEVPDTDNKKKVEVSFVDANLETEKAKRDDETIDLPIIRNKTKETEIKFRKVRTENLGTDKEHLGLGDAKFRLMSLNLVDGGFYLKEGFTDHSTPTTNGDRVDGQQARGGGYITFDGLNQGEYLLEELQAPKGYNKTTLYGWKLVVKELKADDEATGKKKGDLDYKLYEVPTGKDLNRTDLKEVNLDQIINGKDKKISAFQIGNDARKISVPFKKYKGKIVEKDGKTDIEATEDTTKLYGKNGKPVSFDLYKSDFYGAIIGDKDKDGNIIPYKKNITQDANGNFNLEGLEFGGYYILRETNPPAGYDKAADITLKVEAEAIADEGKMKVIVRDPNTNAKTDFHSVFQGVIDFEEGEKLGKFSIKKVGNAIGAKDENGNPIKVGLRRAYFRLYTANDKYEIEYKDPEKKYPKEYIQKVTPGVPITKPDGKGGQTGKTPEEIEQEAPNQGIVTFDQLKPGKYVLEEYRGPAGYERDPNYWYILVDRDGTVHKYRDNPANTTNPRTADYSTQSIRYQTFGLDRIEPIGLGTLMKSVSGIEISDENTPQNVMASGWQNVDPARSDTEKVYKNQTNGRVESRILAINKDDGSKAYKQQILVTPNKKTKQVIDLARVNGTNTDDTKILSVKEVGQGSTLDKIVGTPTDIKYTRGKIQEGSSNVYKPRITTVATDKPILIEIEVPYSEGERIGLRVEYFLDGIGVGKKPSPYEKGYDNEDAINKESQTYKVSIDPNITNGIVTADKTENLKEGDTVILTVTPKDGYQLKSLSYTANGVTTPISGNSFTMPAGDVTVSAVFEEKQTAPETYNINLIQNAGGRLTISPQGPYKAGDNVTVTITPDSGKKLDKLIVDGNQVSVTGNTYTFKMPAKNIDVSASFIDDGTSTPTGDMTVRANFTYTNQSNGIDDSKNPPQGSPGTIRLEVNKKQGLVDGWVAVSKQPAKYKGTVDFTNLDPNMDYRLVYERKDEIASGWGTDYETIIPIDSTKADKNNVVTVDISNGNLIEIFNKDETGFRIPLRISKVNENKAALTGSQFKARKLINGEKVKLYEKNDDGTYTDTGKVGYPKYHDEKFDGVSEATGKPGDNYFRELTPGIYELTEIKTPNDSYRLPKDKDGKDMKWYFKVVINKDKVPSDAGYMDITFDFEHTFKATDDFNSAISEAEREDLIGKTIKGFTRGDPDFARYIEEVKDDGRSDPARPDAPYKWIHDARVTNYKNKTKLGFMKKDSETHRNISGAVFSLRKAKLDKDGNLVFENNKPAYAPEKTTGKDGKPLTEAELNLQRVQPYNKEKQFATAVSNEKLGVEFTNIDEGTYILEEIKPADGYKKTDSFLAITFTEGEDGAWQQKVKAYAKDKDGVYQVMPEPNDFVGKDDAGGFVSVKNDKAYTKLKFQKIEGNKDSDGNEVPVESADFRLTQVDKDGNKVPDGYEKNIYSYGNSNFEFTKIPVGRYKLQETRAITKFEKPDPWFFNVVQDPDTHKLKIVFENDPNGKLDESIGFKTKADGSPDYDADGNLQDIKIRNYSKTNFSFMKYKNETEDGKKLPLKDAYFRLTKVRYSMDKGAKAYEYHTEKDGAGLKKYTNGKKVTEYKPDGSVEKYTYDGDVIDSSDKDNYKPDFITNATGKYSSLRRSQSDGSVDFQDLGEGIYQLEEVGIPDGYQSGKDQTKWIFEVKKTDNGLKVEHNVTTEKTYFENYDNKYYTDFYGDYYNKVYTNKAEKPNIEQGAEGSKYPYNITNTKSTTNLKWKKIGSRNKDNVIEKYTKFALVKTSDDPADIDYDINSKDKTEVEKVKNAISGQSKYPPYLVESTEGIFEIKDLSKGIYNLIEIDAPEGYKKATRNIAIKVYEDKDGAIKKQFYEIENGKLIKEVKDFNTLLTRNAQNPEVDTDTDEDKTFYFNNESKPYHFNLSKGFMEKGVFKDITKGKLKVKIYADPADKTNTDTNVYEQTIDLSDAKSYRINLNSNIKLGKDYILEEVESPDGYAKTNYRYRLRFAYDTSWDTPFVATLVAVLKEVENKDGTKTWTPLKNASGQNITDSGQLLAGGQSINSGFQFRIVNNKTEVEFTKVGKDQVKNADGKLEYVEKTLKGVDFYLEKQDPDDIHKKNQGYYPLTKNMEMIKPETDDKGNTTYYYIDRETGKKVTKTKLVLDVTPENSRGTYTSNDQGKFKITDLTDGYYRIKEPKAPTASDGKPYMQVLGAVKKFKVDQGRIYVFEQDNITGQEVAKELTDANIKDLGKIINLKHGDGKFELNKTDENNGALENVEFELYNSEGTKIDDYTTDANGKIIFEGLPYGTYWLRETKTKDGYIVDRRIRQVRLGKDWNVPSKPSKPKDVTKNIKFNGSQPQLKSIGSQTSSYDVVYPNQQEAMLAYFKFKIDEGTDVKAGDTFTLKFSDNVDLYGIFVDNQGKGNTDDANFNIYSDAGLVAKAKVNPDKRSITYTFTEYLDNYNVSEMRLSLQLYADRYKVPFSQNINVTASVGNTYSDGIYVDYRGNTPGEDHRGYQDPRVDVSSYMLRLNPDTGEFTTVVYYNPWNDTTSNNRYFEFSTSAPVDINSVKLFEKTGYGSHANGPQQGDLPDSYGIDFENANSYAAQGLTKKTGTFAAKDYSYQNYYMYIDQNGGTKDSTYVMVIQGKLRDKTTTKSLKTTAYYNFPYWNYNYWETNNYGYFHTWSQFYRPEGTSEGDQKELSLNLVNFKNRIEFMKVDGGVKANVVDTSTTSGESLKDTKVGSALKGAKFKLQFRKDKKGEWTETNYGERISDDKGFFSWEGLAPGYYQVIETETPDNNLYDLRTKEIASFTVDENGNIVDVVPDDLILENYKKAEIKIKKTDEKGNIITTGADFTLTPEEGLKDPSTGKNIPAITKTTGDDGLATFDKLVAGKYTLTEEKAPEGYKKSDQTWNIEVTKDGKVLWTNSFDDSNDQMKATQNLTYQGEKTTHLDIEVLGIDKVNKTKRSIITVKAKPSELRNKRILVENSTFISQLNTKVRLVVSDDGKTISKPDSTSYKLEKVGTGFSMALTINPQLGEGAGTETEKDRYYKFIVDLPYSQETNSMTEVKYQALNEKGEFTNIETLNKTLTSIDENITANNVDMTVYEGKYLARDINLLTTEIGNKKLVNLYYRKVDYADKTKGLEGAVFELQNKDGTSLDPKRTATSDEDGYFAFEDIPDGEYKITEIKAPNGYALTKRTIEPPFIVKDGKVRRSKFTFTNTSKDKSKPITNQKALYPQTGGPGTWLGFTIIGAILMSLGAIYLALKKKQQLNQANPTT